MLSCHLTGSCALQTALDGHRGRSLGSVSCSPPSALVRASITRIPLGWSAFNAALVLTLGASIARPCRSVLDFGGACSRSLKRASDHSGTPAARISERAPFLGRLSRRHQALEHEPDRSPRVTRSLQHRAMDQRNERVGHVVERSGWSFAHLAEQGGDQVGEAAPGPALQHVIAGGEGRVARSVPLQLDVEPGLIGITLKPSRWRSRAEAASLPCSAPPRMRLRVAMSCSLCRRSSSRSSGSLPS